MTRPRASSLEMLPMIPLEEGRRLLTYEHSCRNNEDCEPPLRCVYNTRRGERYCTASTCMNDQHCPEGFACRALLTDDERALVRICSLVGLRKEGEKCEFLPSTPETGCEQGLLCQGWCGRPCTMDDSSSCPQGFLCADGPNGASCLPTCKNRTCPDGQQCTDFGEHVSVCATVHGQNCHLTPCPEGQRCHTEGISNRSDAVWMSCLAPCGGNKPPCPNGLVCDVFRCRQSCDPNGPNTCGPHRHCGRHSESRPWTCIPTL